MFIFHKPTVVKRSPLKNPPLRMPGQSVQEDIDRITDKFADHAVLFGLAWFAALMEWVRWIFKLPPQPLVFSALAVLVSAFVIMKAIKTRRRLRILRQARDGEKVIGQSLERLRERGYRVLHDIVGNGFNIDHVLIGPTGIYTIETKTISKPTKGCCEIVYDGEKIRVNGFMPDRDPIVQAKAQAGWIKGFLKDVITQQMAVRPVVLYPGWYVKAPSHGCEVWVLNPDVLPGFLRNERTSLDARDIQAIEGCLSVYVRKTEQIKI